MASKPESTFTAGVHRFLPPADELHREKMHNPYRGGTADYWYSGRASDLWVEYKFIMVPSRDDTAISLCSGRNPTLSALQQDWLSRREAEGRRVWVIVGCKVGGVVMRSETEWRRAWRASEFRHAILNRADIAQEILNCVEPP
jgi:hypothetical protein